MREDLRTAFRSLRSSPTFTTVALFVLSLGIGAATAIFSVVDAVVLRGLPFEEHDRLAVVQEVDTLRATTFGGGTTTPQTYLDWRARHESFDGLAAVGASSYRLKTEGTEPADARGLRVTWEFFAALRVTPLLGRALTADDEIIGQHRVAILSHGFWQRRYGGAPDVVGRTIDLNEEPWQIVGVMPQWFSYPVAADRPTELYVPVTFSADDRIKANSRNYNWTVIGRLQEGVSMEQAHGQMNRLAETLEQENPKWSPGRRARVISLHHYLVGRVRPWMLMLLGAVGLLLLITCANVANLMLARGTARVREVGIRAALGASRGRLIRALIVEGIVLSLLGALIGVGLAYAGVEFIRAWLPSGLPRIANIAIDLRVLGAAVTAAVATGALFGIIPALQSSLSDVTTVLKEGGRSSTLSAAGHRVRNTLVVAEVAIAVVLLVGAGLFLGSFVQLIRIDPGFDYRGVLTFSVSRPTPLARTKEEIEENQKRGGAYVLQVLDAVKRVPGIEMAAAGNGGLPLTGSWSRNSVKLPGGQEFRNDTNRGGDDNSIDQRSVTPDYLPLLRVPLRRGRHLTDHDRDGAPQVVLINEAAARKYWPDRDPLGQTLIVNNRERTVVGIVGDIRHLGPEQPTRQEVYIPFAQQPSGAAALVMRSVGVPTSVIPAVKAAIWSVNPEQRLTQDIVTLEGYMDRLIAQRRFNMAMLVLFGVLGLVITVAGIYGVMAYIVEQRTSEIGVRMALGASPASVLTMVMRRASLLIALGLAIGASAAWYLSTTVQTFLFQIEPHDPRVVTTALIALSAAGLLASAIPARRAARVDPVVALRQE